MTSRFEFEKARDFGAVIGDALQFFARNFKSLLLGFLTYVGPFLVLGILAMVYIGRQIGEMMISGPDNFIFPTSVLFMFPTFMLASMMVFVFVCAAVEKYQESEAPVGQNLWPYVRRNIGPGIVAMFLVFLVIILPLLVLGALAFLAGEFAGLAIGILVAVPVVVYLSVPLSIFIVLHLLEKNSPGVSMRRAFRLVSGKWWITFAIYLVVALLASVVSSILSIPAYILFMIQSFGAMESGDISGMFGMWMGVFYALGLLGSLFASIYQILGMILQYYSLREQKEGHGLMRRIESLDQPDHLNLV